ncbi:unnamed protein product [Closterium sp. Yama58-4]|nr:unnamed protein product [Closterium sp. Yama58-4]
MTSHEEQWETLQFGTPGSSSFRMIFLHATHRHILSPCHDIPLYDPDCLFHCISAAPAGTWLPHDFAPEDYNPLRCAPSVASADSGDSSALGGSSGGVSEGAVDSAVVPKHFSTNCPWSLGLLPQTRQDPDDTCDELPNVPGDEQPIEVIEISGSEIALGEVVSVKPLAAFAVASPTGKSFAWKVVAISGNCPVASVLESMEDVEASFPGSLNDIREWLRTRDVLQSNGRHAADLPFVSEPLGPEHAHAVVARANATWQLFVDQNVPAEPWAPPAAVLNGSFLESIWKRKYMGDCAPSAAIPVSQPAHLQQKQQQQQAENAAQKAAGEAVAGALVEEKPANGNAAAAEPSRRSWIAVPSLRHTDAASGGQRAAPEIDDCATAHRGKGGADASPLPSASCHIDRLPNELVAAILRDVFKKAQSLSDIVSLLLTCRRFYDICRPASQWSLLASASVESLLPTDAAHWTPAVQRFLLSAATEGNIEAIYIAGMISFYCIGNHWAGARLLAQAAEFGHGPATYSLAIINFHGSGGTARDTNPQAGVDLCWRAAKLGFMPALQELGHCFVDGYGVSQRISLGKLLLQHASAAMEGSTSTCRCGNCPSSPTSPSPNPYSFPCAASAPPHSPAALSAPLTTVPAVPAAPAARLDTQVRIVVGQARQVRAASACPRRTSPWDPARHDFNPEARHNRCWVSHASPARGRVSTAASSGDNVEAAATEDGAAEPHSLPSDAASLKAALYSGLEGLNRGIFGMPLAKRAYLHTIIERLEELNPRPAPTEHIDEITGEWRLLYSTIAILGSKRTKLGLRDFISLGDFLQIVDKDTRRAANVVEFAVRGLGLLSGKLTIEATYTIASPTRVDIKFESSSIVPDQLNKLFEKNYDLLLRIFNPDGWLEITYVDDTVRIGRDDKGNIFVVERQPPKQ